MEHLTPETRALVKRLPKVIKVRCDGYYDDYRLTIRRLQQGWVVGYKSIWECGEFWEKEIVKNDLNKAIKTLYKEMMKK